MLVRVYGLVNKLEFDLNLVYQERFGDILFLTGTILSIISTFQAEQSLFSKALGNRTIQDNSAYTIVAASWLFFAASLIFWYTAAIRLAELKRITKHNSFSSEIIGSQISTTGSAIKAIGFGLAAIGNQIKAYSSGQRTVISQ